MFGTLHLFFAGRNCCGAGLTEEELNVAKVVLAAEKQRRKAEQEESESKEKEDSASKKSSKGSKKKKGASNAIRLSDGSRAPVDLVAAANLWQRVREMVQAKYDYDLPMQVEQSARTKVRMLRSVCLKVGIQLACRDYDFDAVGPIFTVDDVLDLYPVVKTNTPKSKDALGA